MPRHRATGHRDQGRSPESRFNPLPLVKNQRFARLAKLEVRVELRWIGWSENGLFITQSSGGSLQH